MSPVDGIGNANPVAPAVNTGGGHAGHGAGTATTFAVAYANALANAPAAGGHAHVGPAAAQGGTPGAPHGGHGAASSRGVRHIPLDGQHREGHHGFQQMVLGLRGYRQQLIASNIANADTPNYKAVDIDFRDAVRIAQAAMAGETSLATTNSRHLAATASNTPWGVPLKYHAPWQPSADGNTTEMDVERAKFAENAVMYEFSLDRVKGHFAMMQELLKNLR